MAHDIQSVKKDLGSATWSVRTEAIRKLEFMGDDAAKALPELISKLQDDSQYVRSAAARVLGKVGNETAVTPLTKALTDKAFHVRQGAIWALAELGVASEPALPELEKLQESKERFPQAELTVAELAGYAVSQIRSAVEAANAPAEAESGEADSGGKLSADERKAKREAAMARKKAAAEGAAEEAGKLSADERQAKREAALARKRAREAGNE